MTEKRPWPQEFSGQYHELLKLTTDATIYAQIGLKYGLGGHRNLSLLEWLTSQIEWTARRVRTIIRELNRNRTGEGWPRWVIWTLEDGYTLADTMVRYACAAEKARKITNLSATSLCLTKCNRAADDLIALLLSGPAPDGGQDTWAEAEMMVLEKFAEWEQADD